MARYVYEDVIRDGNGVICRGSNVTVYLAGTTTLANVYAASAGGAHVNSVTTATDGSYAFWVDTADYGVQNFKVVATLSGFIAATLDNIVIQGLYGGAASGYATLDANLKLVQDPNAWVDVSNYASLTAAVTAIGATPTTLLIRNNTTITGATTIPATLSVKVFYPGTITKVAGTLTINGPFESGLYQVFSGFSAGDVTFETGAVKEVVPPWWGAKGDGATEDHVAINLALATGKKTKLAAATTYLIGGKLEIPSNGILEGGGYSTVLKLKSGYADNTGIRNSGITGAGNTNITIRNFRFHTLNTSTYGAGSYPGNIRFERVVGLTIENIYTSSDFSSVYTAIDLSGGVSQATVNGCRLINTSASSGAALWVRGGQSDDATLNDSAIEITNCYLEAASDEAVSLYGWFNNISNISITNCAIKNTGSTELTLGILGFNIANQDGTVNNVVVSSCTITGKTNILTGASFITLADNIITGPTTAKDALNINGYTGGAAVPSNIILTGNTINGGGRFGIYSTATKSLYANNKIFNTADDAIVLDGTSTDTIVTGNYLAPASGGNGVTIDSTGVIVTNNFVYGAAYGIFGFDNISTSIIKDNVVHESVTGGVYVNGNAQTINDLIIEGNKVLNLGTAVTSGIYAGNGTYTGLLVTNNKVKNATTGFLFSAPAIRKGNVLYSSGTSAYEAWPIVKGTTANRPTLNSNEISFFYLDTTLDADGKPIWWNGTAWVDATGATV